MWVLYLHPTYPTDAAPWLSPHTFAYVWRHPERLALGLSFALPALFILLCHEMGHYLACRHHRLASTPPYFLPLPIGLGTLGAFIRIRSPIRNRRQLFDVGIAGPLAGFVALLPFLLLGIAWSQPVAVTPVAAGTVLPAGTSALSLYRPGRCLALELTARLFHGALPAGTILHFHPFALAAWFGLLVTAVNLLPIGQLDGGHIFYAAAPRVQHQLSLPVWLALAAAGYWFLGWLVWVTLLLLMGLRHPPVGDEQVPLGAGRRWLAWLALAILVASFMPVPVGEIVVALPTPAGF